MKLHYKAILLPIIVMVTIVIISMISIEQHLGKLLQKQFEQELKTLANFSLAVITAKKTTDNVELNTKNLDEFADILGQSSDARITFISKDGRILGDSQLSLSEIVNTEEHSNRKEVIQAIASGYGQSNRLSSTLQNNMTYFAVYDDKLSLIARVSLPQTVFDASVFSSRITYSIAISITIVFTVIFGLFVIHWIRKAVAHEHEIQQQKLHLYTREFTLIQAMTTLLLNAEKISDAGQTLSNIMPKIFSNCSGKIFLNGAELGTNTLISEWGNNFPDNVSSLPINCWSNKRTKRNRRKKSAICQDSQCFYKQQLICISLKVESEIIGVLQLYDNDAPISKSQQVAMIELAKQISTALANIQQKDQLRHQATRDPLTNLYNRRFMLENFEQALNSAERHSRHLAVLMIDIDFFKQFNDKFGHEAGDLVLKEVAQQFQQNLRLEDIACRYGGEEFCVVCPDIGLKDAYVLAEKLRKQINKLNIELGEITLDTISVSIGISIFPNHAQSAPLLIAQADKALYAAKDRGRNHTLVAPLQTIFQNKV